MTAKTASVWDSSSKGLLPIVIGVTGHLDMVPDDAMTQGIIDVFDYLKASYPHTPLVLLSPLAAGADQFVAELAVRSKIRLIVPMPMPRHLYEKDFKDPAIFKKYKTLLDRAELVLELPLREGDSEEDVFEGSEARNYQYARVGAYIVQHCQLLIALWDGFPSTSIGGTGHIVPFMLEGVPEPYDPSYTPVDLPERGPVYHIQTQRKVNNGSVPDSGYHDQFPKCYPDQGRGSGEAAITETSFHIDYPRIFKDHKDAKRVYDSLLKKVEVFNLDYLMHSTEDRRKQSAELFYSGNVSRPDIEGIREHYLAADLLAQKYHSSTLKTFARLFFMVFLAALFFELFGHSVWKNFAAFVLYAISLVIAYVLFFMAWIDNRQNKHQDYRALAEGLRVQFFWRLSGLEDSVADYYLRKQRSEMDWVPKAIRVWNVRPVRSVDKKSMNPDWDRMQEILEHWTKNQAGYYEKASARDHRSLIKRKLIIRSLLALTLLITGVFLYLHIYEEISEHTEHVVMYMIGIMSVAAALLHGHMEKRAFVEHVKQYERMAELFSHADGRLKEFISSKNPDKAYRLIIELGKEALIEHGDWLFLHRERPLEVPHK